MTENPCVASSILARTTILSQEQALSGAFFVDCKKDPSVHISKGGFFPGNEELHFLNTLYMAELVMEGRKPPLVEIGRLIFQKSFIWASRSVLSFWE